VLVLPGEQAVFPLVFGFSCITTATIREAFELMIDACRMANASIPGATQTTLLQKDAGPPKKTVPAKPL